MYDLLNEPIPGDHRPQYTEPLAALYKRIIAAIREVDTRHLITLEGTNWSNDWSMFTELWDDQLVLQFHKYWNPPDQASIQTYLDVREQLDVPIWLGETGENNLRWFQGNFGLADSLGIGWNFWPWKKLDTENSPASIRKPRDWELVQAAAADGEKPDREVAQRILDEYLANIPYAACDHRDEVVNAMLRRAPVPLAPEHAARVSSARRAGAVDDFRVADPITVGFVDSSRAGGVDWANTGMGAPKPSEELEVRLEAGEWVEYDVEVAARARLEVVARGHGDATLDILVDGTAIEILDASAAFAAGRSDDVDGGVHAVRVVVRSGAIALRLVDVRPAL
jgi:endoglucanase